VWRRCVLAPFGAFALNLQCHHGCHLHGPRGARRPGAPLHSRGRRAARCTCCIGIFGATVTGRADRVPRKNWSLAIAGLALLAAPLRRPCAGSGTNPHREAALITFLGHAAAAWSLAGIGSAFWAWSPARWRCLAQYGNHGRSHGLRARSTLRDRPAVTALTAPSPRAQPRQTSSLHILFVADPLESFKIYKDTTFSMMRELQRRGHTLAACEPKDIMCAAAAACVHRLCARHHARPDQPLV